MSQDQIASGSWAIAILIASVLFIGCNTDSTQAVNAIDFHQRTLANCLKESGAVFASSTDDLDFFTQAETEDTASNFGFFFDDPTKLFVDLWEDGYDPREWLMWVAQPFDEEQSPSAIVESSQSGSYVAFMFNPTLDERRTAKACTD